MISGKIAFEYSGHMVCQRGVGELHVVICDEQSRSNLLRYMELAKKILDGERCAHDLENQCHRLDDSFYVIGQ